MEPFVVTLFDQQPKGFFAVAALVRRLQVHHVTRHVPLDPAHRREPLATVEALHLPVFVRFLVTLQRRRAFERATALLALERPQRMDDAHVILENLLGGPFGATHVADIPPHFVHIPVVADQVVGLFELHVANGAHVP
jgi:hypothetical protein